MYMNERYPNQLKDFTLSITVNNKPGVLARITGLITRRGFNIESLSAGDARETGLYRITLIVKGDEPSIQRIQKQIYKMEDTVRVFLVKEESKIEKEFALIKVKAINGEKLEYLRLIELYKGHVLDTTTEGFVVQMAGSRDKVDRFIQLFPSHQVVDIARTGAVAMTRWD